MNVMHSMNHVAIAGYIISLIFLNLVAYLISSFYQKKFSQASPRMGFAIAIGCMVLYSAGSLIGPEAHPALPMLKITLLFAGAVSSSWNALALYYTMKRVRK